MFADFSIHLAWLSECDHIGGNVLDNQRACANHRIVANGDAGKHGNVGVQPHITADDDRHRILCDLLAQVRTNRMAGGNDSAVRADHGMFADMHFTIINQREVEIGVSVRTEIRVASPIGMQRRFDISVLAEFAKQLACDFVALRHLAGAGCVEVVQQFHLFLLRFDHLFVIAGVNQSGIHSVKHSLRHSHGSLLAVVHIPCDYI